MVGRKQTPGTAASSQVRVQPIWNEPIDRRKFARAVIALVLWQLEHDPDQPRDTAGPVDRDMVENEVRRA